MPEPIATANSGVLHSVNTARALPLHVQGRRYLSAIGKRPASGAVGVAMLGLDGDEQADLSIHGGLTKALYAYPIEHYAFWRAQRSQHNPDLLESEVGFGNMGENLSISGVLEHETYVGDELHFANCVLRVTAPREPCFKFNAVMGFRQAGRLMALEARCGFYLAVERPGSLCAGETFEVKPGRRALSIRQAIHGKLAKHLR